MLTDKVLNHKTILTLQVPLPTEWKVQSSICGSTAGALMFSVMDACAASATHCGPEMVARLTSSRVAEMEPPA